MTTTQLRQLERIKNRHTLYELTISRPGATYLFVYCRKGRRGLLEACRNRGELLIELTGCDAITFGQRAEDGATIGDWTIRLSGRTQREAILAGELPWIGDL